MYSRVALQSVTTPVVDDVARSRQNETWPIVGGSASVKFVLFVVNDCAPMKPGSVSISRVYDLAPASGCQRNRTGSVGKLNVSRSSGEVIVGAAPHCFVKVPFVNVPTPAAPSVAATRQ